MIFYLYSYKISQSYSYIEWSLHNPHDGEYNWEGIADVVKFLEIAQEEDFYIVLRPGPYICAERDNVSSIKVILNYILF